MREDGGSLPRGNHRGPLCDWRAGSVVTKDIPPGSFAAGVPCQVIRRLTEADSMKYKREVLADNLVIENEIT